jgi:hypothetical protein
MDDQRSRLCRRHLVFGWTSLLVFAVLGVVLESLHAFKTDAYLAFGNETRRMLWRLAHAHGAVLALVHVAFAVTVTHAGERLPRVGSACLLGASIALPGGFLLGGIDAHDGDPGIGIVLVPLGALLLFTAIGGVLRSLRAN